ncbi:hypothetical protein [Gemmatimonas groenlandica]|uniref:hypothetical protein n=1 Tax=Gemmatimonas groenlandica TaxID=2732249 RepID=UPI001981AE77|nr:hypothetical protein [Gemmatimonas groenlandica]
MPRTQEGKTWALRDPAGIIQWPVDLVELRGSSGTQRVWIGMDSSKVEYTVASMPPGGMASAIPMVMENRCMLPVGGHRALTHRLRSDSTVTKRALYLADATVVVRDNVAIHVWIEAPSAGRRDLLLRAVSELTLR